VGRVVEANHLLVSPGGKCVRFVFMPAHKLEEIKKPMAEAAPSNSARVKER
jgi:hypothetical protein